MMKSQHKKLVVATLITSLFWTGTARADMPVIDPSAIAQSIKNAAQEAAQHSALMAQLLQVAGMQSSANEQTQKQIAKAQSDEGKANRQADNAKEQVKRDTDAAVAYRPTLTACQQRAGGGAASGARGGGGYKSPNQQISVDRETTSNPLDSLNKTLGNKVADKDLCTALDGTRSSQRGNGCGGEGTKANADLKAGSIFAAAGTGPTAVLNANGTPKNASMADPNFVMNDKDQKIAQMSIANIISGLPPTLLPEKAEATPGGRAYRGAVDRYNARLSTGIDALSYMASLRAEAKNLTPTQKEGWTKTLKPYAEMLYPNRKISDNPSTYEIMNTQVYMSDTKKYQDDLAKLDSDHLTRLMINRIDTMMQVQWQTYNMMERNTAVNSAAMAQGVEPITQDAIARFKASAESQVK